jgi:hypothetical protein
LISSCTPVNSRPLPNNSGGDGIRSAGGRDCAGPVISSTLRAPDGCTPLANIKLRRHVIDLIRGRRKNEPPFSEAAFEACRAHLACGRKVAHPPLQVRDHPARAASAAWSASSWRWGLVHREASETRSSTLPDGSCAAEYRPGGRKARKAEPGWRRRPGGAQRGLP